jgi:hypothetical protein
VSEQSFKELQAVGFIDATGYVLRFLIAFGPALDELDGGAVAKPHIKSPLTFLVYRALNYIYLFKTLFPLILRQIANINKGTQMTMLHQSMYLCNSINTKIAIKECPIACMKSFGELLILLNYVCKCVGRFA